MKRLGFILFSTLFHALLTLAVMQLPPVFPSSSASPGKGYTYVEVMDTEPVYDSMGPEPPARMLDAPPGFMGPEPPPAMVDAADGDMGPEPSGEPMPVTLPELPAKGSVVIAKAEEAPKPEPEPEAKPEPEPAPKPAPEQKPAPAPKPKPAKKPAARPKSAAKPKPPEFTPVERQDSPAKPEAGVRDVDYDNRRMWPFEKVDTAPVPPDERAAEPAEPARAGAMPDTTAGEAGEAVAAKPKPAPAVRPAPDELPVRVEAIRSGRNAVSFMHRTGWPDPPMLGFEVGMPQADSPVLWRADADQDWIIVTPGSGVGPASVKVGVMAGLLGPGFQKGTLTIRSASPGYGPATVEVSVMVLPEDPGISYLPHTGWDDYVNGDCKVCHLPEEAMPFDGYLQSPEFCELCHTGKGIASGVLPGRGGHPVGVEAGAAGSHRPPPGTIPDGIYSDDMSSHLPGGMVTCITCHNVMNKPGDLGRAWELCSREAAGTYRAEMGGWSNMGHIEPRVYVMKELAVRPDSFGKFKKYRVPPDGFTYDPDYGTITLKEPAADDEYVYVTLSEPYLRVPSANGAHCYACHDQSTHMGLECLDCHQMHGTRNRRALRERVYTGGGRQADVRFSSSKGPGSFADGDGKRDGICEVCHTKTKYHTRSQKGGATAAHHAGEDCTACHPHSSGFGG